VRWKKPPLSFDRALKLRLSIGPSRECSLRNALGQSVRPAVDCARPGALRNRTALGSRHSGSGSLGKAARRATLGPIPRQPGPPKGGAPNSMKKPQSIAGDSAIDNGKPTRVATWASAPFRGRLEEARVELDSALQASRETGHLLAQATILCNSD
jgi:hypothetical protein